MKKIIGWVPFCVKVTGCFGNAGLGLWPKYFATAKKQVRSDVNVNDGFRFKYLPVYVELPEKRK